MNVIGDVDNSVSWEKSKEVMNIAKYNINECRNCFAFRECMSCVKNFQSELNKMEKSKTECEIRRQSFHDKLVTIIMLEENLYS